MVWKKGFSCRQCQFKTTPPCQVSFRYSFWILGNPTSAGSTSTTTGTFVLKMASLQLCQQIGALHLVGFHPTSAILANRKFFKWCRLLYYSLIVSWSQLVQQSIAKYGQKAIKPAHIPPVTKSGIQEHLLAIITTCDLVSLRLSLCWIH